MSRVSHAHYPLLARLVVGVLPPLAAFDFVSCAIMLDVAVVVVVVVCVLPSFSLLLLFVSYNNDRDEDGEDEDVDVICITSAGDAE